MSDFIWLLVGFFFTLLIFSYLFGDNPFFRLATYIFIGATAGYGAVLIIYQVLIPKLYEPISKGDILNIIPLLLGILLLLKVFPRTSRLGNISMGYLVGVGSAVIVSGAVLGTLFGQIRASINLFNTKTGSGNWFVQVLEGCFILLGTVSTLIYFHFSAITKANRLPRRSLIIEGIARVGGIFIAITLGALFAGVVTSTLTALIERLDFIRYTFSVILGKLL